MSHNRNQVFDSLTEIFRDLFDNPNIILSDHLTAEEVDGWDSLNHINLIVAVEKKFRIKLTIRDAKNLKNVGELVDLILQKIS